MEKEKINLFQQNIKDFDLFISNFFYKDCLSMDDYFSLFPVFTEVLKKKTKELELILNEKHNTKEFYEYVENVIKEIEAKEKELKKTYDIDNTTDYMFLVKKNYYCSILEYLKKEKKSKNFQLLVEEEFFCDLEDIIYDYLYRKHIRVTREDRKVE